MALAILSTPITPQGPQKMVHYPSYLRLDPLWYAGVSKWSDGSTDADIYLMPSKIVSGGVSQNANLTIQTLMTNGAKYLEQMYSETYSRSVASAGYLRMVADPWTAVWKRLKSVRYNTYKAINKTNWTTVSAVAGTMKVLTLDSTRFVLVYKQANTGVYAVAGSIATTGVITYGTAQQITSTGIDNSADGMDAAVIGTDKFVVASRHTGSETFATVCTVATLVITVGTPTTCGMGVTTGWIRCCKADTDKYVIVEYETTATSVEAICATVSGTTSTFGAVVVITTDNSTTCGIIEQLATDVFVVGTGVASAMSLYACTIATRTITVGTAKATLNSLDVCHAYSYASNKFIVWFRCDTAGVDNVALYTVSGTTITLASQIKVNYEAGVTLALAANGSGNVAFMLPTTISYASNKVYFCYFGNSTVAGPQSNALDFTGDVLTVDMSGGANGLSQLVAGKGEINGSANFVGIGKELISFPVTAPQTANGFAMGRVGVYDILIGSTSATTANTQCAVVFKNITTEFFNGDTSISSQLPTLPAFVVQTFKCDSVMGGPIAYIKLQNDGGEAINYNIYDVGVIAE